MKVSDQPVSEGESLLTCFASLRQINAHVKLKALTKLSTQRKLSVGFEK